MTTTGSNCSGFSPVNFTQFFSIFIFLQNVLLGLGGPECGDIYLFMEEGYNIIHADSLSTQKVIFFAQQAVVWSDNDSPVFVQEF